MIRPKAGPGLARPRGLALALTVALMLTARAGLRGLSIPAFASNREVIRALDPLVFERYSTPPGPEEASPAREVEAPEGELETSSLDRDVGLAMEEISRRLGAQPLASVPSAEPSDRSGASVPGLEADLSVTAFEAVFGDAAPAVVRPEREGRPRRGPAPGRVGLGIVARSAPGVDGRDGAEGARGTGPALSVEVEAQRGATVDVANVVIRDHDATELGGSDVEALARWMRTNRSPLPVGVRMHFAYESAFLTSATRFDAGDRSLELFLMFNETLRELHIVLVEGERSVYLIDRGFQDQTRSLREGTVRRVDGEIIAVDSRGGAASSDRAQEFHSIFRSWWDLVRQDVRTP